MMVTFIERSKILGEKKAENEEGMMSLYLKQSQH